MSDDLEEGGSLRIDFTKLDSVAGVVPCAVQNVDTGEVILIAYVNQVALQHTAKRRVATFWSTSRDELWEKGATSGEGFEVVEVLVNCEQNSLVYRVRPQRSGICHTKNRFGEPRNCFYRRIDLGWMGLEPINATVDGDSGLVS